MMKEKPFCSDIEFPEQYFGVLVRSSIQRGRLVDITTPPLPDGYHFYTATDIPGENRISAFGTSVPIFTPYEIHYFGEPVGIMVGPDLSIVYELVSNVLLETEKLEPFKFGEKFAASQLVGKRIIYSGEPELEFPEKGSSERELHNENREFETTTEIGTLDHQYAEPLCVNVHIKDDKLEICAATQWAFHVRTSVSAVLDLDPSDIIVSPSSIGESLDGKIWFPSLLAAQASLAAVLCKKSVKILFTKQEDFLFSGKSAPAQIRFRTAIAPDGTIKALIARILINAGAYSPLIDEIIDRITIAASGLYDVKKYRIETYAIRTSCPPMGTMSGWGEAQVLFALETHIASIVPKTNLTPVEWKLINIKQPANDIDDLFESICVASDFPRKYAAYQLLSERRKDYKDGVLKGIGLVTGYQGNGFIGKVQKGIRYSLEICMETDGSLLIKSGIQSLSIQNIIKKTASSILGIENDLIHFVGYDTNTMSETGPESLSINMAIILPLVEKCCTAIQKQRFRQPLPISVKRTYKPSRTDTWDKEKLEGNPYISITKAACVIELELDPSSYKTKIVGIWLACNAGKIQDKKAVIATIKKSLPAAFSRILGEHIIIQEGKLCSKDNNQSEGIIPSQAPSISILLSDSQDVSKGLGTITHNLIPAAYATALSQITGKKVNSIPLDPEEIYQIFKKKEDE
ncbi:MAG TPA: molybdopterin cofactor-binding domain-containing protein [Treponemataceae bacterium]|nr:molybdopterin cofactor-binding domain-containing protein [Treponemataceae bacterium]